MRSRLVLPAVVLISVLLLIPALAAGAAKPGSKTESGGTHVTPPTAGTEPSHSTPSPWHGWDWVGPVSLGVYTGGVGNPLEIVSFRFANVCDRAGTSFRNLSILADGRGQTFHYHGGGLLITGNVIGRPGHPVEIAGFASMRLHGCASGPWWFDAYPGP
jgi:hypothetical protein